MKYLIFLLSFLFEVHENYSSSIYDKPVPEVIESYGYPSQTHSIYTEDGYNLILHRIPYGRHCKKEKSTPVLLVHGFFLSSLSWLFLGPENSLGFLLADNCYDVWLANSRGNCYSRGHKYLSRKDPKYWDFDWHEMGVYDNTASVVYIVNVTKQKDVLYVGVSQSGTSGLVNAILRPETKIKAYFLMAPISYLTKSISPLRALGPAEPVITILTILLGNFEVSLNSPPLQTVEKFICDIVPGICSFPFGVCGYDPINLNRTAASELLTHSCGISIKQLLHYFQGFNFVEFSQYNYGGFINRIKYGTYIVPKYKVETIKKPVYVYHGRNDLCVDSGDLKRLVQELGDNLARVHLIDDPLFDHLVDYVAHNRAKELIYDELLSDMSKVSN